MEKEILDSYKLAGKITAQVRDYGKSLIKKGVKALEVCNLIEAKIKELGGVPAFPPQISINEVAAHFCPDEEDQTEFKEGNIVKLDVGVHVNGFVGDSAVTVNLGGDEDLVRASRDALNAALKIARPKITLSEIGRTIEETIKSYGFKPVRNLSGHGLGRFQIHTFPTIPNFDNKDLFELEENMVIAIEPFATNGLGLIHEKGIATIFSLVQERPVRSMITRQILRDVKAFNELPFALRWLTKKHGLGKTMFAIKEMKNLGMIREYPPLPEQSGGFVSQAEHSLIVKDKPIILTKSE
ncbi:MAG: type II methionyl aminopeptidase [Nanoarchaeota archaeon]|nr:type II methionyl aminopeptidase [Nanoarchaeota archaeon]MBU1031218.1 type II methionyl aminopeptidase [Nanoarchaeota archaeon]MBU1849212.1 type II methionyl aminopeptidase [Nanoarchaeota archaeon]